MIELSREIRFALASTGELESQRESKNSWAAFPASNRIVPHLILKAVVTGQPNPDTGYLCNITVIDAALREFVTGDLIPSIQDVTVAQLPTAEQVTRRAWTRMTQSVPTGVELVNVSLHLSPQLGYLIESRNPNMVELTQQFEFSAAHRLHCESLSAEENLATFGKCNNPAGHGHNYVVEVTVARDSMGPDDTVIEIGSLAKIVNRNVIDRLDHKNLNEDIEHFNNINPSVENIAAAVFDWLRGDIESAGCDLKSVKVFETPKTWATYTG